jgi:hypothetical protein
MRYQIQRLSFGGIFDHSFQLMRDHFVSLTLGFMILYVPYSLALSMLGMDDPKNMSMGKLGVFFGVALVMMIVAPLFQLTATSAIADAYQSQPTDFKTAFAKGRKLYAPYLGTAFVMFLFLIPLFMLLAVPGLIFMVYWMLIGPIAVVEQVYGRKALARSRALVRGHWWRTFGVTMVAGLAVTALTMGMQTLFAFIPLVGAVATGLLQAVTATYMAALIVVLYVDLRCRHEDFDLQVLAREVAGSSGAPSAVAVPGDAAAV